MKISINSNIQTHKPVIHGGLNSLNVGRNVLDFSSNVSPLGMPDSVKRSIRQNLDSMENYPDIHSSKLEDSIKQYVGFNNENVVVSNGATELIYNFCRSFLSKKTPVLLPVPTFGEYHLAAKLSGCNISTFQTMNLEDDLESFLAKIPKNGCVFICNPNNPTGSLVSKKSMKKIISNSYKKSSIVFVDECFIELTPDFNESIITLIKKFDNLFVLRSLTKSFGLAGIRIGYGIGNKQFISILKKIRIPWSVNSLAQKAGITALKHLSHIKKTNKVIKKESKYLKENISKISGFECYDSSTNFILIKTKYDSTYLQKKLLKKKILIRDCKNFLGLNNNYIRIAVKTRQENRQLLDELVKL